VLHGYWLDRGVEDLSGLSVNWRLRTLQTDSDPGSVFREFWGDEENWAGLLSYAWRNYGDYGQQLAIPSAASKAPHHPRVFQLWTAITHLLTLGLGWNDPCGGLREWRARGYPGGLHAVLDFVGRTVGDEVEALELFFGLVRRDWILNSLPGRYSDNEIPVDLAELRAAEYAMRRQRWHSGDARLGTLLVDGADSLHLDPHVGKSIRGEGLQDFGTPEVSPIGPDGDLLMHVPRYSGWIHALYDWSRNYGYRHDLQRCAVHVYIVQLGVIGRFRFDEQTSRWSIDSTSIPGERSSFDVHRWGVINFEGDGSAIADPVT